MGKIGEKISEKMGEKMGEKMDEKMGGNMRRREGDGLSLLICRCGCQINSRHRFGTPGLGGWDIFRAPR
jgi:hypothetical protein